MNGRQVLSIGTMVIAGVALVGCESPGPYPSPGYSGGPGYGYSSYSSFHGTVESVEVIREAGRPTGAGAVIGGIAGGLLGHQIGSGSGNTAATIGGAVGGAVVGNEIERRRSADETYRFRVRMDDGSIQTFIQDTPNMRVGDRVRNDNGRLVHY